MIRSFISRIFGILKFRRKPITEQTEKQNVSRHIRTSLGIYLILSKYIHYPVVHNLSLAEQIRRLRCRRTALVAGFLSLVL